MAIRTRDLIKSWFKNTFRPDEDQFADLFDSIWFKEDQIPVNNNYLQNVEQLFDAKADVVDLNSHVQNTDVHLTEAQQAFLLTLYPIQIDGFNATFYPVSGTRTNPQKGDLALNRKISDTEFVMTSVYIGDDNADPQDGTSWQIVSSIIYLGEEPVVIEDPDPVDPQDPVKEDIEVFAFQFDGISKTIDDIGILSDTYLEENGSKFTEEALLAGVNITYSNLGRYGFKVTNVSGEIYNIYDVLGNKVNESFESYYDALNKDLYLVSKDFIVPSTLYYKFVKLV